MSEAESPRGRREVQGPVAIAPGTDSMLSAAH